MEFSVKYNYDWILHDYISLILVTVVLLFMMNLAI